MTLDTTLPPPLFDIEDDSPTATIDAAWDAIFHQTGHGVALTDVGRHHGLGPGILPPPYCGLAHYDAITVSAGRRAWIWHACSVVGSHEQHHCDRCEVTW